MKLNKTSILAAMTAAFFMGAIPARASLINLNSTTAPPISCTTTSSRVALSNPGAPSIEVFNAGTATVFLVYGDSAVTAVFPTSTALPGKIVGAGVVAIYSKSGTATHVACITSSGTATVYVTTASGE